MHILVDRYVDLHLEFTHFYSYHIFRKIASTVKIQFCDHYLRAVSPAPTHQESYVDVIAHILHSVLPNTALFINLNKFSQNHCLREFWNLYLVGYNREAMEITRISIYDEFLLLEDHDEYIAASFENV